MLLDQWSLVEGDEARFTPPSPGSGHYRRPAFSEHIGPRLSVGETVHRLRLTTDHHPLVTDGETTLPLVVGVSASTASSTRSALRAARNTKTTPITTSRYRAAHAASPGHTVTRSSFDASRAVAAALSSTDDDAVIALLVASR